MKAYAIAVTIVALLAVGLLFGANVQPILTGAGYVVFPENVTSASIHATNGQLQIKAGGTDQSILFYPTGTGYTLFNSGSVNGVGFRATGNPVFPGGTGKGVEVAVISNLAHVYGYDRTAFGGITMSLQNWGGRLLVGTATDDGSNMLQVNGNVKVTGKANLTAPGNSTGDVVTTDGTQTLTNKTINYLNNTITNLPTGGFTTFGTTAIAVNTVYQNTSGQTQYIQFPAFVTGVGTTALAYADLANPPTTAVSVFSGALAGAQYGTFSFMVLNNYYWKIDAAASLYDSKARVWQ